MHDDGCANVVIFVFICCFGHIHAYPKCMARNLCFVCASAIVCVSKCTCASVSVPMNYVRRVEMSKY